MYNTLLSNAYKILMYNGLGSLNKSLINNNNINFICYDKIYENTGM